MKPSLLLLTGLLLVLVLSPALILGDGTALKKWLDGATKVTFSEIYSAPVPIKLTEVTTDVVKVENTGPIKTAKSKNSNKLQVYYNNKPGEAIDPDRQTNTNYLPFRDNKATFLQLNYPDQGDWFITAELSGCDVWIVDHANLESYAIHINANNIGDPVQNLQHKQTLAEAALDYINRQTGKSFQFTLRVSYDYAKKYPDQKDKINNYWSTFQTKYNLKPVLYYVTETTGVGLFYGMYYIESSDKGWKHNLKLLKSGKILYGIKCSETKPSCVII